MRELRTFRATRAATTEGREFFGQAAVFDTETPIGNPYRWGFFEKVNRAAFDASIASDDIVMLADHDPAKPLARTSAGTLELSTSDGLDVRAPEIPATSYGNDLIINLRVENVKGMSFGFEVLDDDWSTRDEVMPDGTKVPVEVRELKQVRLFEVSTTAFPAYLTTSAGVRAALLTRKIDAGRRMLSLRGYADACMLRDQLVAEMREGKTFSSASIEALQEILDLIAAADEAVDEAQPLLAGLIGVPNPDDDDEADDDEGPDATDSDPNDDQERSARFGGLHDRRFSALVALTGLKPVDRRAVVDNYQPKPYDADGEGAGEPVTCPHCGLGDAEDAKFCDQCGFELQGADGVQVAA